MLVAIGVGDCKVSDDPEATLVTYGLGSCIAVMIHDMEAQVGGLLHFMLPDSSLDAGKARAQPYLYADTGIPLLFRKAYELGAHKRRLVVGVAGGGQMMDEDGVFNIGKRNYAAMHRILRKAGVRVDLEETGGTVSRTVGLEVGTGRMWLRGLEEAE